MNQSKPNCICGCHTEKYQSAPLDIKCKVHSQPKECIHYKLDLEGKCVECKKLIPIKCMCQDKAAEGQPHVHHTPPSSPLEEKIDKWEIEFDSRFSIFDGSQKIIKHVVYSAWIKEFISEVIADCRAEDKERTIEIADKMISNNMKDTSEALAYRMVLIELINSLSNKT